MDGFALQIGCTHLAVNLKLVTRVARWFVFKPKIQIWINFGGPYIVKCLYILRPLGIFYGDWGYFMTIWYILNSYGTFSGFDIMYHEKSGNPAGDQMSLLKNRQRCIPTPFRQN
jgi:hypothetical protein